jgi:stage IV sporulation protein FB
MMWIDVGLGRLGLRFHLFLPLAVGALCLVSGDLWLRYILLLLTLFVHELAHALAALSLGRGRALVSMWPYFGRADVERFGDRRTALVALSGPAANLVCAGALFLAGGRPTVALGTAPLLDLAQTAHLLMGLINLLPIPPVDGGRALVALRNRV